MLRFFDLESHLKNAVPSGAGLLVLLIFCFLPARGSQSPVVGANAPVLEGVVRDSTATPIRGAVVRLELQNLISSGAAVVTAKTDEGGKYVLVAPRAGHYTLRATADGFRPLVIKDLDLDGPERQRSDLVLQVAVYGGVPFDEPGSAKPETPQMQFSDQPSFTVAGITDRSNMGLHGSDANVRTSDALARETAALRSGSAPKSATFGAGDAHRRAGDAKEKSGDPLGAVKEYEAAVKVEPSEQNYLAWGAELLLHRAGRAAVQVFSNGAQAYPESAHMLAGLGVAYYSNGQYNEAAAQLCRASGLNPADSAPYLFLGRMEQAAADPLPCSETALSRFAANQPANPLANFFYGLVLWKNARKTQDRTNSERAEQLFRKALEAKPAFAEAYLQLGMLYNARGEKDQALDAFQKAVSADQKSSQAHYQLSLACRRSGDVARADAEMKTYQELRRSEDAALEKERREVRQFVTILQDGKSDRP